MRRLMGIGLLCGVLGACTASPAPGSIRYAVFFQEWSASLDDGGKAIVADAADWANKHPTVEVHVIGYADPEGSPQANREISRTRAQVVADGLAEDGVARPRIIIDGRGSVPFTLDSQESRRVTISLGSP